MRKSWDRYFMDIAVAVSSRATCDRKHVGAVFVDEHRHILATGYNGSITGHPHCDDIGHLMEDGHCIRTVHAEVNAIAHAAKIGVCLRGATLYSTASLCWNCFKAVANTGVSRIVYESFYRDDRLFKGAELSGIALEHFPPEDQ